MHRRRFTKRVLADLAGGGQPVKEHLANWLAEDEPMSLKTEPFDERKCAYKVTVKPDTFTHHQGDYRGAAWQEPKPGGREPRTLWLLALGVHNVGYTRACRRAETPDFYPLSSEQDDRDEAADRHAFAEAFCDAARRLQELGPGEREIEAGGYWAKIELVFGAPEYAWAVSFRQTKDAKDAAAEWIDIADITKLVASLFANASVEDPTVSSTAFSVYEYIVEGAEARTAAGWNTALCEAAVGL